ncbi:MAG: HPr family phosphocarrier protein [Gammaproteobacteria bacterium]|nr:HPr family phosphocarrier protein [Gammaproteobacteria bacterium]
MTDGEVVIVNALGLHARAAAKLVNLAKTFTCSIELCVGDKNVDAKSIMKVMMLAAGQGTVLTLRTSGDEEKEAFAAVSCLIRCRFGEEQ